MAGTLEYLKGFFATVADPTPPVLLGAGPAELAVEWTCGDHDLVQHYDVEVVGPVDSDDSDDFNDAHCRWRRMARTQDTRAVIVGLEPDAYYKVRIGASANSGRMCYSLPGAMATSGFRTLGTDPAHERAQRNLRECMYHGLLAAEAAYASNPQLFLRSISRTHILEVDFIMDDSVVEDKIGLDVVLFTTTDQHTCYLAFKGPATPFYSENVSLGVCKRLIGIIKPRKMLRRLIFVGYDNGGTAAAQTLLPLLETRAFDSANADIVDSVLEARDGQRHVDPSSPDSPPATAHLGYSDTSLFVGCITYGAPLMMASAHPAALQYRHLFHHVVHARDPVPFEGLTADNTWRSKFTELTQSCACVGQYLMDVSIPTIDTMFGCQKDVVSGHLRQLSSTVYKKYIAAMQDRGALAVMGALQIVGHGAAYDSDDVDCDDTASSVVDVDALEGHLAGQPAFTVDNLECHMPVQYACVVLPEDEATPPGYYARRPIRLGPEVTEDCTYISVFGNTIEAVLYGKNLKYTRCVVLNASSQRPDDDSDAPLPTSASLTINEVQMHKITARIDVAEVGLIHNDMYLELEVSSDFGCTVVRDVRCVEYISLRPVEGWAAQFISMDLEPLLLSALRFSLLRQDGDWACNKLHAALHAMEEVPSFIRNHNQQWLRRMMVLPVTKMDVPKTAHLKAVYASGLDGSLCDEDVYQQTRGHIMEAVSALGTEIKISLSKQRGDMEKWTILIGKVAAAIGGVAVVMTPPGQALLAGTVTAQYCDTLQHVVGCQAPYHEKLLYLIQTLGMRPDKVPNEVYYYELLLHGRLREHLSPDTIAGEMDAFEDAFMQKYDEFFDPKEHWMAFCDPEDRRTFARLLWTVGNIFTIRKALTNMFVVQVFGQTDAGKTTVIRNVFGVESAKPGSMVNDVTTRKSGYNVDYCDKLIAVDNPGIVDSKGRGEVVLDHASFYLVAVNWDGGMRAVPFIIRLAEIQFSNVPFRLIVTKCDYMVMNGWKRERIQQWLAEHLRLLNEILADCRMFLSHHEDVDISGPLKDALIASKTLWSDVHRIESIGSTPITPDDCMLACVSAIDDAEFAALRDKKCRQEGVMMVADVREALSDLWAADLGFSVAFPEHSPQDVGGA